MFLGNWSCVEDVVRDFKGGNELKEAEVLLASYGNGSYCGRAFVLYRKDGELFEVDGDHCSCNGLEGQWSPGRTTCALQGRNFGDSDYRRRRGVAGSVEEKVVSELEVEAQF